MFPSHTGLQMSFQRRLLRGKLSVLGVSVTCISCPLCPREAAAQPRCLRTARTQLAWRPCDMWVFANTCPLWPFLRRGPSTRASVSAREVGFRMISFGPMPMKCSGRPVLVCPGVVQTRSRLTPAPLPPPHGPRRGRGGASSAAHDPGSPVLDTARRCERGASDSQEPFTPHADFLGFGDFVARHWGWMCTRICTRMEFLWASEINCGNYK